MIEKEKQTFLEANGIIIRPYMRGPTKQFLPQIKGLLRTESNPSFSNWDNFSNYSNYGNYDNYGNYSNYNNFSNCQSSNSRAANITEISVTNKKLNEILQIREDCEEYGFVHNLRNNIIFFTNSKAIKLITELAEKDINSIRKTHPEILSALQI